MKKTAFYRRSALLKRLLAAAVCAAVCLSLCACNAQKQATPALTVSGASVSNEVFAYYVAEVMKNPIGYSLSEAPSSDEIMNRATALCAEYVAVNSTFSSNALSLSSEHRHSIAQSVSTSWSFYESFYTAAGISKQTLNKIRTCEAKRDMLLSFFFDDGGKYALSKQQLSDYFNENYVSFKAINGYLTKIDESGNAVPLSFDESDALKSKFSTMLYEARTGSDFETIVSKYSNEELISAYTGEIITINKQTNNYPTGFFDKVHALDAGTPELIELANYIFLVTRTTQTDDELIETYHSDCLKALCSSDMSELLAGITATYSVEKNSSSMQEVYRIVNAAF